MKLLHLCSDFSKQKIYQTLFSNLAHIGGPELHQDIFVPIRDHTEEGKNYFLHTNVDFNYEKILNKPDRLFFHNKVSKIERSIAANNLGPHDVIHAHFLFSDGSVAYRLKLLSNTPYVVSVRNTDINYFFKFRKDLHSHALNILLNASVIHLLTPSYIDHLQRSIGSSTFSKISHKISIIPNPLHDYWLANLSEPRPFSNSNDIINLVCVAELSRNKNILQLIDFVLTSPRNYHLHLVGKPGNATNAILNKVKKSARVTYHGYLQDVHELRAIYRQSEIFVLLSKRETFGVAYLEALSQGLPIIYSRRQGVDGCFSQPVGRSAAYNSMKQLRSAVSEIISDYQNLSYSATREIIRFSPERISLQHLSNYRSI